MSNLFGRFRILAVGKVRLPFLSSQNGAQTAMVRSQACEKLRFLNTLSTLIPS